MNATALSNRQQKTRLIFLNALLRLVIEKGLDRVTVTDIANEAGYGRWTFYQYFKSPEDAAWAAFVHWMTQLDTYLVSAVQHLESPYREYESWRIIFQAFQQQTRFFSRLDSIITSEWHARAKEFLIQQFLQHLRDGHFRLMDGVRPEIAARLYALCGSDYGATGILGTDTGIREYGAAGGRVFHIYLQSSPAKIYDINNMC
jgi:AcrR family transcriptional regulator